MLSLLATVFLMSATAGTSAEPPNVHVGRLREVTPTHMELDGRNGSLLSIGFFGEPDVIEQLKGVRVGQEVRAVFGAEVPPGGSREINKLLSIRPCAKKDAECDADRKAEQDEEDRHARMFAQMQQRHEACRQEMNQSLAADPRYVAPRKMRPAKAERLMAEVNALTGNAEVCADEIMKGHQAAVLDACLQQGCGEGIGGGCYHIAGYALTDAVFERAAQVCKGK